MDILDSYGLAQHVTGATHRAGHCLDFLITRQELCVRSVIVDPPVSSVSDHSTIVAQLDLLVPQDHSTVLRLQRCWRKFDVDRFIDDLSSSAFILDTIDNDQNDNVDDLFE